MKEAKRQSARGFLMSVYTDPLTGAAAQIAIQHTGLWETAKMFSHSYGKCAIGQ